MMVDQVIAISGTPGTGKTAVGNTLAKRLNAEVIELGQVVKDQGFHYGEDSDRETLIINIEALQNYMVQQFQNSEKRFVIIGHFADIVSEEFLAVLVVLRCHPVILTKRLSNRQWPVKKILENIQAEILGVCTSQSLSQHNRSKIYEIDTTDLSVDEVVTAIEVILAGKGHQYNLGKVSWLHSLDPQLIHQIMEENRLPTPSQKA
jgi:adenylate kinase